MPIESPINVCYHAHKHFCFSLMPFSSFQFILYCRCTKIFSTFHLKTEIKPFTSSLRPPESRISQNSVTSSSPPQTCWSAEENYFTLFMNPIKSLKQVISSGDAFSVSEEQKVEASVIRKRRRLRRGRPAMKLYVKNFCSEETKKHLFLIVQIAFPLPSTPTVDKFLKGRG